MNELLRILGNDEGEVVVTLSGNQIQFQIDDEKTGSKHDPDLAPDRRPVPQLRARHPRPGHQDADPGARPPRRRRQARLHRRPRLAPAASSCGPPKTATRLTITAESGSVGNAYEEVEVARTGDDTPVEIAFNAKYLSDVLGVLDTEGLHIELTEPLRPGVIRPTDTADYLRADADGWRLRSK